MDSDTCTLTRDQIYKSSESVNTTPLSEIKYVELTLHFNNLSLLTQLTNLRIIVLRLCSFQFFPDELFQVKSLQSIDLSENQISNLPPTYKFFTLTDLKKLNLSDNNISDLEEVNKLEPLSNLTQLKLTGNSCLTPMDSFEKIAGIFPKLIVLNERIILSQYRGCIEGMVNFDKNSLISVSKLDDYIFLYVKFLQSSNNDKLYRRWLCETFCLSKVLRRYSSVVKIQSVFRGFLAKKQFFDLKQSTKFLQNFFQFRHSKKVNSVSKIKSVFLHFLLRKRIKEVVNARKIQAVWRGHKARQICLVSMFENCGKFQFYVTTPHLRHLKNFLKKRNLPFPDKEEKSNLRKIRVIEAKKQRLPGSPLVFYTIDKSALIRSVAVKKPSSDSVWCRHSHSCGNREICVSHSGVNFSGDCHFRVVSYKPYKKSVTPTKLTEYDQFVKCTYDSRGVFSEVVLRLCSEMPAKIRLFSERTILRISSLLTVQSACRMFLVRSRLFKDVRTEALEKRCAMCIRHFFHSCFFKQSLTHSLNVLRFFRLLPDTNVFYIAKEKLDEIFLGRVQPMRKVNFGYSTDRCVLVEPGKMQLPMLFVPTGKIVYCEQHISSLFKLGVTSTKVTSSLFECEMPPKWLERSRMVRLTFATAEEARIRISLYTYLTGDFGGLMDESGVIRFCAANAIRNAYVGFVMRKTIVHLGNQAGKSINLRCLMKRNNCEEPTVKAANGGQKSERRARFEFTCWKDELENYKKKCPYVQRIEKKAKKEEPSKSMYQMGLVNSLENAFARTNPAEEQERKIAKFRSSLVSSQSIKKPSVAQSRSKIKPVRFEIELESQKIFAPLIHQLPKRTQSQFGQTLFAFKSCKLRAPTAAVLKRGLAASMPLPDIRPNTPLEASSTSFATQESSARSSASEKGRIADSAGKAANSSEKFTNSAPQFEGKTANSSKKLTNSAPQFEGKTANSKFEGKTDNSGRQFEGKTDNSANTKDRPSRLNDKRKPLFDDSCRNHHESSQRPSDARNLRERMKTAFSKLVRLRQIGIEIEESVITDKAIEENRQKASIIRGEMFDLKKNATTCKNELLKENRSRNKIEKRIFDEQLTINAARASRNGRNIRSGTETSVTKDQKSFSNQFVTSSQKVAFESEKVRLPKEKVVVKGDPAAELRSASKEKQAEVSQRKLHEAQWAKLLNEQRDEKAAKSHENKLKRVQLNRSSEMAKRLKKAKLASICGCKISNEEPVVMDVIEGASRLIGSYMGGNCGEVESHLIVEIIGNII